MRLLSRRFFVRRRWLNIQRILILILSLSMILLFYLAYQMKKDYYFPLYRKHTPPVVDYVCSRENAEYYEVRVSFRSFFQHFLNFFTF